MGLLEVLGWQAPPVWAALEQLALMRFATLLAQRFVHLEVVVVPAAAVGLPELAVPVELVESAARSPKLVWDLF
ncbi:MAG: hypothetical protein NTZ53_11635 [Cyanobacteria bacterium]|nr:hypothetical protein [Cyanobacteriota bacterium]